MRILSVLGKNYGGKLGAIEPMYLEFTDPLMDLGHTVEHFDHNEARKQFGLDGCGDHFVKQVKGGRYDLVLYATAGQDWMPPDAIREAGRSAPIVAWNSDDDWQWEIYTKKLASYFTFVVTTYPHIYELNKNKYPNLRLSQWACYDRYADFAHEKDLNFTFVGAIYTHRNSECRFLRKHAGLRAFGVGSGLVKLDLPYFRGASRISSFYGRAVNVQQLNDIWNRSKVSFTPMGASCNPNLWQIKGRVFQMGLSGTLMLCQPSPNLERYYEPGKEFVPFRTLEDCAEKAKYYLAHELERRRIASAYYNRTKAEHLWQNRFVKLFSDIGLGAT